MKTLNTIKYTLKNERINKLQIEKFIFGINQIAFFTGDKEININTYLIVYTNILHIVLQVLNFNTNQ